MQTRAWQQLLAFVLAVACGGKYDSSAGKGGSSGTPTTPGDPPDGDPPDVQPTEPGTSAGRGGRPGVGGSVGIGGGSAGGDVGMAGSSGIGGYIVGTAGTNAGIPVTDTELCEGYCASFAKACPQSVDAGSCYKLCASDLYIASTACYIEKRESYACIKSELERTVTCDVALAYAGKFCGSKAGQPVGCDEVCEQELYGDGTGCHAITTCASGRAELHCPENGPNPTCSCAINGEFWGYVPTNHQSGKAACTDDYVRRSCTAVLP